MMQRRIVFVSLLLILVAGLAPPADASGCLRPDYVGIQQGLSNIVQPWNSIDFYRDKVVGDWGFEAVKVWDRWYGPQDGQFSRLINDPAIDVIVYRPLYQSGAALNTHPRWENIDYGTVASQIYQSYGHLDKVVILTGWEQDNQYYGSGVSYADYLQLLDDRQSGIAAARAANPGAALRIYHAVEINIVPPSYSPGSSNILHQFIPNMASPPDMISYSAWGAVSPPGKLTSRLNVIEQASGLSRDNIFIGEFGYNITASSHNFVNTFLTEARSWGSRLALLWEFNQGVQVTPHVVYPEDGANAGAAGFALESGTQWYAAPTVGVVQSHRNPSKVCASYW